MKKENKKFKNIGLKNPRNNNIFNFIIDIMDIIDT